MSHANSHRGEAELIVRGERHVLRPSYNALVSAEEELGPLFALVERAGSGQLRLSEIATLFWYCLPEDARPERVVVGQAIADMGLAAAAKPLRSLLAQILQGSE